MIFFTTLRILYKPRERAPAVLFESDIFHVYENVLHLHEPEDTPLAETNENAVLMNILSLMILTRICNLLLQCLGVCQVFTR